MTLKYHRNWRIKFISDTDITDNTALSRIFYFQNRTVIMLMFTFCIVTLSSALHWSPNEEVGRVSLSSDHRASATNVSTQGCLAWEPKQKSVRSRWTMEMAERQEEFGELHQSCWLSKDVSNSCRHRPSHMKHEHYQQTINSQSRSQQLPQ